MEPTLRQQAEEYLGVRIGLLEWGKAKADAERKRDYIIWREGDADGERRKPYYLAQLIAEAVRANGSTIWGKKESPRTKARAIPYRHPYCSTGKEKLQ